MQAQKTLQAKKIEVDIAGEDAEIEIARARGIGDKLLRFANLIASH